MVRVKRGKTAHKRRKKLLKYTKGFRWARKNKYAQAREALLHAWTYSFRDRRAKKRNFRQLWEIQISAACKQNHLSYNKFIHALKEKKIELNRKILAELAQSQPMVFEKIIKTCFPK